MGPVMDISQENWLQSKLEVMKKFLHIKNLLQFADS